MPRDINGNFSLDPSNPVVPGTVIETGWANPTLADIAAALTDSLSRSGSGGMLAPFRFSDGTLAAPGIAFTNEPSSGLYRAALNDIRFAIGSSDVLRFIPSGVTVPAGKTISGAIGSATSTGTFATVTTPMLRSTGSINAIQIEIPGYADSWVFGHSGDGGAFYPNSDANTDIGKTVNRVRTGYFFSVIAGQSAFQQYAPNVGARAAGNGIEFGHNNPAGYGSTLGAESANGNPFLAFNAGAGTAGNSYKTLGQKGAVFKSDLNGGFLWATVPNANADNQVASQIAALTNGGFFVVGTVDGGAGTLYLRQNGNVNLAIASALSGDGDYQQMTHLGHGVAGRPTPADATGAINSLHTYLDAAILELSAGSTSPSGISIRGLGSATRPSTIDFYTSSSLQLQIQNLAGANRNLTIVGSIGGNPTIGTTGGSINFSAPIVPVAGLAPAFESAPQTPPAGATILTIAHGLGRLPKHWRVVMRFISAAASYAIGDEVDITAAFGSQTSSVSATSFFHVTNAGVYQVTSRTPASGATVDITANIKLVFYAW